MLNISVTVVGNMEDWSKAEYLKAERAVKSGIAGATMAIKAAWRAEVQATLGERLSMAVRSKVYPEGEPSADAAGLIWTKAQKVISAHETGAVIRGRHGRWLVIPLPAAGPGLKGPRITPEEWERRTGRVLRFVSRNGRTAILVDDGTVARGPRSRVARTGKVQRGRRTQWVPIFALVPQVRLKKRLSLFKTAETIAGSVPGRIVAAWEK